MGTEEKQLSLPVCSHRITDFNNITLEELEHIASCDICADKYANAIEQYTMIKAPHYLKDNILQEYRAFTKVRKEKTNNRLHLPWKKLQLFGYSMKIGLAMCGALILINFAPAGSTPREKPSGMSDFIYRMNSELKEFSNNILEYTDHLVLNGNKENKEDINYDKKKE